MKKKAPPAKAEKPKVAPKAAAKAPAKKEAKPVTKPVAKAAEKSSSAGKSAATTKAPTKPVAPSKKPEAPAAAPAAPAKPAGTVTKTVGGKTPITVVSKPAGTSASPGASGARPSGPVKAPMKKPPVVINTKNVPTALLPKSKGGSSAPAPQQMTSADGKTKFKAAFQNDFVDGKAAAAKLFLAAGLGNLKHQKLPTLEEEMAAKPLTKSPLNKAQLKEFKDVLLAKRAELVGDVQSMESEALTGGSGSLSNLPQHMADQGTDTFDQTMALNIAATKRQIVRDIDAALRRIEDNMFGVCEILGKPIEVARLQAEPWTRYSIEGARHKERMNLMR